ncbi:UNVERIFIED_CONTAM: hypothetical protein K2H54_042771 [Gekko kuhli]
MYTTQKEFSEKKNEEKHYLSSCHKENCPFQVVHRSVLKPVAAMFPFAEATLLEYWRPPLHKGTPAFCLAGHADSETTTTTKEHNISGGFSVVFLVAAEE